MAGGGGGYEMGLYEYRDGEYTEVDVSVAQEWAQDVVMYVHGWQRGAFNSGPDSFVTPSQVYGEARDVSLPWTRAGYRVLCFLWVPFADEDDLAAAEQKIWSSGPDGVQRRRRPDGGFVEASHVGDVGTAAAEAYRGIAALAPRICLVGHSLGCQVVGRVLELLLAGVPSSGRPGVALPLRVVLLDPYFSNFGKSYLGGQWAGERVREAVRLAAEAGCAVEQIASSTVLENWLSDSNVELRFYTAYFVLRPEFIKLAFGVRDIEVLADRHSHARYAYFASLDAPCGGGGPREGQVRGLAGRADADVRRMMTSESHWVQAEGADRWDPTEFIFERRAGSASRVRPPGPTQYA